MTHTLKSIDIFNMLINSGLFAILLGLVISAIKFAKSYLDAKTAETTAKINDTNIKNAISSAEDCVTTVVLEMSQTVVDDLKAKSADGKLTEDEIKQIQADSLAKIEKLITSDAFNTLDTVFGDAEAWIKSKIEAEVKKYKMNSTAKS
jgi:hypothetical protein